VLAGLVALLVVAFSPQGGGSDVASAPNTYAPPSVFTQSRTITVPAHPRVLIFGDSYTQGWGATPETAGYAYQMGALMGWDVTVDGVGGTGFLNAGTAGTGNFATRIKHLKYGPNSFDLILLQGGSNDQSQKGDMAAAISRTVDAMRAKFPSAKLLLMSPVSLGSSAPPDKARVTNDLLAYAGSHGLMVIDPIAEHWFNSATVQQYENMELGHPNAKGYAYIAQTLKRDLGQIIVYA
jgi:acyl-CoA thioesterase I